jgi:cupin 2 domain-containing protein
MAKPFGNIFDLIPEQLKSQEVFEELLKHDNLRIERICSSGQISPEGFWYDQDEHEWVILLQGFATIEFPDGYRIEMKAGDHVLLSANKKHRVAYTSTEPVCIWLAIFWK